MGYVRVVLVLLLLFGGSWLLYRMGKSMGWWGGTLVPARPTRRPASPAPPRALAKPKPETLEGAVWEAAYNHPAGVWLYTREGRMLRITMVGTIVDPRAVLYVERVEGKSYAERIMYRKAMVQLFTFRRDGESCGMQSVLLKPGGAPDFELEFAHDVVASQAITGLTPSDDMLRKLATDLVRADVIKCE